MPILHNGSNRRRHHHQVAATFLACDFKLLNRAWTSQALQSRDSDANYKHPNRLFIYE